MRGNSRVRGDSRVIGAGLVGAGVCATLALSRGPGRGRHAARQIAPRPRGRRRRRGKTPSRRQPVIVFLKSQRPRQRGTTTRYGRRSALIQAAQTPYLDQLRQLGATDVHSYQLVNAISARVPAAAEARISDSPGVAAVIPDSPIVGPSPVGGDRGRARGGRGAGGAGREREPGRDGRGGDGDGAASSKPTTVTTPPGTCSATPQLSPDGLSLTHTDSAAASAVTARSLGYTGAGVKVAFLADGIDPSNANLQRDGKSVITSYQDFSGDGTSAPTQGGEAFLDANAIAGQGKQVYNVAGFSAQAPGPACDIRIEGMAPGASLVALKVFSNDNVSTTSGFLQAIDYAVNVQHVNVLNESFGSNPFPDVTSLDAVKEFNDMATAAGVTVVVAAGDAGDFNTIGSPASDPARHLGRRVHRFPLLRADRLRGRGQVRARRLGERQHQLALQRRVHPGRADPRPGGAGRPVLLLLHR